MSASAGQRLASRSKLQIAEIGLFAPWTERWSDLIDFEIVPVETSSDFWARYNAKGAVPGPRA